MHGNEVNSARRTEAVGERATVGGSRDADSLRLEMQAVADSAVGHMRKVAATATTEAQLSVASAAAIATVAILSLALLTISWTCVVALGIWLAVQAGWPVWLALIAAIGVNLTGVLICRLWYAKLVPNLGFARTRRLIFPKAPGS